jgi:hypothetical protein
MWNLQQEAAVDWITQIDWQLAIILRLDLTQDPNERICLICILEEMELDRLRPKEISQNSMMKMEI